MEGASFVVPWCLDFLAALASMIPETGTFRFTTGFRPPVEVLIPLDSEASALLRVSFLEFSAGLPYKSKEAEEIMILSTGK